jgi:hypothetical protein
LTAVWLADDDGALGGEFFAGRQHHVQLDDVLACCGVRMDDVCGTEFRRARPLAFVTEEPLEARDRLTGRDKTLRRVEVHRKWSHSPIRAHRPVPFAMYRPFAMRSTLPASLSVWRQIFLLTI